jgi:hypothetical protein
MAHAILRRNARSPHMPLMEFYLYPPKYISPAAIAALAPPPNLPPGETDLYRSSKPQLSGDKQTLDYLNAIQQTSDGRMPHTAGASA